VQQLAYLMRSGMPDALDLMVSLAFGRQAIQLLAAGAHGRMLAVRGGRYADVPIGQLLDGQKLVDVALYDPSTYRARLQAINGMPMFLY
jgi:ATP-dependent phosphofructokinase / diphosphate-dependent phosphofructokinase